MQLTTLLWMLSLYVKVRATRLLTGEEMDLGTLTINPGLPIADSLRSTGTQRCHAPKEIGGCRGSVVSFYFDAAENQCKSFVYGGCGGNDNNFVTMSECRETCEGNDPWSAASCNFDGGDMCGWVNVNTDFRWMLGVAKMSWRRRGKTGVKSDARGSRTGKYVYMLADRGENRTASLLSPALKQSESGCFSFMYHMRGRHMGHLKLFDVVYPGINASSTVYKHVPSNLVWAVYGQQGNLWQRGQVELPPTDPTRIRRLMFAGFDWERGRAGNIVLDELQYSKTGSSCLFTPTWAAPPKTTATYQSTAVSNQLTTEAQTKQTQTTSSYRPKSTTEAQTTQTQTTSSYRPKSTTEALIMYNETVSTRSNANNHDNGTIFGVSQPTRILYTDDTARLGTSKQYLVTSISTTIGYPVESELPTPKPRIANSTDNMDLSSTVTRVPQITEMITKRTIQLTTAVQNNPKLEDGVTDSVEKDNSMLIWIIACIGAVIIIICVIGTIVYRIRKKRRFQYYDNSAVHMTRIASDAPDGEPDMHYYKLT